MDDSEHEQSVADEFRELHPDCQVCGEPACAERIMGRTCIFNCGHSPASLEPIGGESVIVCSDCYDTDW